MKQADDQSSGAERLTPESKLYQAVESFDAAWEAALHGGVAPRIEDWLANVPPAQRPALLHQVRARLGVQD